MVTSYVSAAEAAAIRQEFRNLEATVKATFWDVTWTAWKRDRPTGTWDTGTAGETWVPMGAGTGRLRENGAGGPVAGEVVISIESPYALQTDVSTFDAFRTPDAGKSEHDVSSAYLVIEGRLFRVDAFKPRGGERQHATAYLTEQFNVALPEVAP